MKAQLIVCVLLLSAAPLQADDALIPGAVPIDSFVMGDAAPIMPVGFPVTAGTPAGEPFTAPPIVVGPDGQAVTSQYPPGAMQGGPFAQPGMGAPPCGSCGDPMANPGTVPYGSPMFSPSGMPYGSPQGLVDPGLAEPIFPYSAQTPDVTMLPTTPNGPLPNRNGWTQRYEFGLLPRSNATDGLGHMSTFEFDLDWKYVTPLYPAPFVFSYTQQYDLRLWDGPQTRAGLPIALPGSVHRIGWDFELKSTVPGAWNAVAGFNPSINSDFNGSLSSEAWNWDGRWALLYAPSREITYVLGAAYWDRVNDKIIPWAGIVYRPNQYWQWDLVFPQLRVSAYLWDEFGFRTSLYARAEYHIEAYEIKNTEIDERQKVEIEDWRVLIGVNKDRGDMAYFFEGGWVFGRNVAFNHGTQGFDLTTGAIIRGGVRF